jgi:trehalose 6-phosphate synthase/phosphatase
LLHYMAAALPLRVGDWDAYEAVNQRFADAIADVLEDGDQVWIHDYQLLLVPALLRQRAPGTSIGFFLHVPFPSSEVFGVLPQRDQLLAGMLGADLIGFHTASYKRHFANTALRFLGAPTDLDRVRWDEREVEIGAFPMGVEAQAFANLAAVDEVRRRAQSYRQPGVRLIVGIDRLDYTKGIQRRLLAFEALLHHHPDLRGGIRLVQVAVPSRESVEAYRELRDEVDATVGRIQGEFATSSWSPIHYLYRNLSLEEIVALYRSADVLLVTPLRDGMNLVAKEYVASRPDEDGVLVLSEFAGAAAELSEALLVNPYDVDATADAVQLALEMTAEERQARMRRMHAWVREHNVYRWAGHLIDELSGVPETVFATAR